MKMRSYWLMNFPPVWSIWVFLTVFGVTYWLDQWFPVAVFTGLRTLLIFLASLVFGAWRVIAFYPYPAGKYGRWLTMTPWQFGTRLPNGSIQLNASDMLTVGLLCSITLWDHDISIVTPLAIFLYTYIICATYSTFSGIPWRKYWLKKVLIAAIMPFAFYPVVSVYSMVISLAVCYWLCFSLLREVLKDFPWNQIAWLQSDEEVLTKKSLKTFIAGWPYSALAAIEKKEPRIKNRICEILVPILLAVWWLHAMMALTLDKNCFPLSFILVCIALLGIGIRLSCYLTGTAPPISLWGRIFNGYFIIPKYDRIFLTPLLVVILVFFAVYFMPESTQYAVWIFELTIFALLVILRGFPPSLDQWRQTGAFRIVRSKMIEKQASQVINKPKTVFEKNPVDLLMGK